jgi:hypothetical protein
MRAGEPALGCRPLAAIFVGPSCRHRSQASPWAAHGSTTRGHGVSFAAAMRFGHDSIATAYAEVDILWTKNDFICAAPDRAGTFLQFVI